MADITKFQPHQTADDKIVSDNFLPLFLSLFHVVFGSRS